MEDLKPKMLKALRQFGFVTFKLHVVVINFTSERWGRHLIMQKRANCMKSW